MSVKYLPCGDCGITVHFGSEINEEINSRVTRFTAAAENAKITGVTEYIPAFCSVTVIYDPLETTQKELIKQLKKVRKNRTAGNDFKPVLYRIPVCYDDEFAPDIDSVEKITGLTKEEIIDIHTSRDYPIYMLGFLPGFPYLGNMDARITAPRLETPRVKIPRGSVGIGGNQTGIYPSDSPGGWRLIGKTPVRVYDERKTDPILYRAGDYIRFVKISKEDFLRIDSECEKGTYTAEREEVRRGN